MYNPMLIKIARYKPRKKRIKILKIINEFIYKKNK